MKKITFTVIAFLLFLVLIIVGAYVLFFRPKPQPKQATSEFPVLKDDIQAKNVQIEEIETTNTRTYILHATLTKPLFTVGNLMKGEFLLEGGNTPMYFNLGPPQNKILFGQVRESTASWKQETVADVPTLVGEKKQIRVYVEFQKNLNELDQNTPAYTFALSQQQNYQILNNIIHNTEATVPQPVEFSISQLGVVE